MWGESWEKAKSMCECYDYLLELTVELLKQGIDPCEKYSAHDHEVPPPITGP